MATLHIVAGAVGLLSGIASLTFKKGSRAHRKAGKVFFISMLIMAGLGAYMAYFKPAMLSVVVATLTFYLVATAWMTVVRKKNESGLFEIIALLVVLATGVAGIMFGFEASATEAGTKDGFPAGGYYFFGSVALFAGLLDIRVIVRGGLAGVQRLVRHLWRMCFSLWIATTSFFIGQPQVFPEPISSIELRAIPVVLVILVMLFWLGRTMFTRRFKHA